MLKSILGKVFDSFLWPLLIRRLNNPLSRQTWVRAFAKAARYVPTVSESVAVELAHSPGLKRFLINTFKPDREFPTSSTIAIAMAFELSIETIRISTDSIRMLAANVRREWLAALNRNPILKKSFAEERGKEPSDFMIEGAQCGKELDPVLDNLELVKEKYFISYQTADTVNTIKVWLPDQENILHYRDGLVKTLEIDVNVSQGLDLGFFRGGHDYSLEIAGKIVWLSEVRFDAKRQVEAPTFKSSDPLQPYHRFGEEEEGWQNAIWVR